MPKEFSFFSLSMSALLMLSMIAITTTQQSAYAQPGITTVPGPGISSAPRVTVFDADPKGLAASQAGLTQTEIAADPLLLNYNMIWDQCKDKAINPFGGGSINLAQCQVAIDQAEARYCGIEAYDPRKCNYVSILNTALEEFAGVMSGMLSRSLS